MSEGVKGSVTDRVIGLVTTHALTCTGAQTEPMTLSPPYGGEVSEERCSSAIRSEIGGKKDLPNPFHISTA